MDEDIFNLYFIGSIVPRYPDAEDTNAKWVIIEINSRPGPFIMKMIAGLRNLGFILYSGVSNTTPLRQETDQSYGIFKSQFCKNLELVKATSTRG